jgi:hypothetical protein
MEDYQKEISEKIKNFCKEIPAVEHQREGFKSLRTQRKD